MAAPTVNPLVALPGGWELVLIVLVIVLLFGAKKLPELARNTGRSLRIFKAETKGLMDDDDEGKDAAGAEGSTTQGPRATPELGTAAPHGDPLREELHQSDAMPGDRREGPSA